MTYKEIESELREEGTDRVPGEAAAEERVKLFRDVGAFLRGEPETLDDQTRRTLLAGYPNAGRAPDD